MSAWRFSARCITGHQPSTDRTSISDPRPRTSADADRIKQRLTDEGLEQVEIEADMRSGGLIIKDV